MKYASIDFETRSTVDLNATGVYPYAKHITTDIWCFAYSFDDEPEVGIWRWTEGDPFPERLRQHIEAGGELRAWNASFERVIWKECGVPKYGFPECSDSQWKCTAADASAMALPRALGNASIALGLGEDWAKDVKGSAIMKRMAKPREARKGMKETPDANGLLWWDDKERRDTLYAYCQQDVRVERRIYGATRRLVPGEQALYHFDQLINDRGVRIDRSLIHAMQELADQGIAAATKLMVELTGGAVESPTKRNQLLEWLAWNGTFTDSVAKIPIAELLESKGLPETVRAVLELRADSAKASLAKLKAMLACADKEDDIMRGLLLFHGASTGRWAGKLAQPHNFARPTLDDPEMYIDLVLQRAFDELDMMHNVLELLSSMLRSCIIAKPGNRFVAADFSGIEARVVNWLAGEWEIVQLFTQGDVYMHNAKKMAEMGGKPLPEGANKKTHAKERQGGKAVELGCGFGMGHKKFVTTAKDQYQLEITLEESKQFVDFYRSTHPAVVKYWKDLQHAAMSAVAAKGEVFRVGEGAQVAFTHRGGYLWVVLPSKRPLCYAKPRIKDVETPWSRTAREEATEFNLRIIMEAEALAQGGYLEEADLKLEEKKQVPAKQFAPAVIAWGVDQGRWSEFALYGGLICENIVQAVARDFMADAMTRVEEKGYPVVLTVHDEIISDVPAGHGSVKEFEGLLTVLPEWAQGGEVKCPIVAEGWEGQRYRK